jgi:hypothetical protein
MDILGSTIPSAQFSVNGLGFADESFPLSHHLYFFSNFLDGLPYHISWPLVFGSCFSYGREKTRDAYYNTKLCSKFRGDIGSCVFHFSSYLFCYLCVTHFLYLVLFQVISIACCVFYSHCGNRTVSRDKSIDRRTASWIVFSLWTKHDDNTLISRLLRMHKFKEQICSSWFAPVGSASDYPLLSKWAIYGEVSILCLLFVFR